ncbi:phosphoglycerate dehydrogenase [Streptomyces sp. NPDC048111]|uniref:phosphoglycerate dehydrogenase n=1 Tax=Streptomyces sp. NPDC048111 TaxID=3365500 RepID=UPI00371593AB
MNRPVVTLPVVLIAEELSPATVVALGPDFDVRRCDGTDRAALLAAVADADALLVRSATRVDAEVFAAAPRLRVVARAGVGLDNVDIPAATDAGVLVVNAPTSNVVTAAELACGLLISTARNIPQATASLKRGEWDRSRYSGVELADKTLGILGLGRIGLLVAERMAAFGMRVVAHDPYAQEERAARAGVRLLPLGELLETADFISVHLPRTPETTGLIGEAELALVKPSVRIVNAARGGIVDEEALAAALKDGRVAAAGLDVFAVEPCTDSPLFVLDNVVVTPHLGASTAEAQEKAGLAVAASVRRVLAGELVPEAVNTQAGPVTPEVYPYLALAEKLGRVFAGLAGHPVGSLAIEVAGDIARHDVSALELFALKGMLADVSGTPVSVVNAPLLAARHDIAVDFTTGPACPDRRDSLTLRGTRSDGTPVSVAGAVSGRRHVHRIVGVDDFEVDVELTDRMLFLWYADAPGAIGGAGRILGEGGINIAAMEIARSDAGEAMAAMTVDSEVPGPVLRSLVDELGELGARAVHIGSSISKG